jgi:Family of unknown function (DUF6029)
LKNSLVIICLLVISFINIDGQIRTSISNLLRYGNGDLSLGSTRNDFQYFENLTDVRLGLPENVTVGFRFLYDDPPEVGLPFQGLARRFIEYKKDNLRLRVGNSSELYGRGLTLNLFENRGLAFDTWIDGIKASYKLGNFKASLIAGTIEFTDSINIIRTEKYRLRGGNIEYKVFKSTKVGLSFVSSEAEVPQFNQSIANVKAELPEIYLDFNHGPFGLFLNWANKWTNSSSTNKSSKGYGIYSAVSYASGSLGLTIDYKNYRFDIQDPFLRDDETRTSKLMPFQNPPIVMNEHSYVLLSRALHQVDFNDEVGFQVDANYSINEDLNLSLNYSLSSRHNEFKYVSSSFTFDKVSRSSNFLPSAEKKFSPFSEFFIEAEYYLNPQTAIRSGYANRKKTIYNDFTGLAGSHTIESSVIPFQFEYQFNHNFSSLLQFEFEAVNDNFNSEQEKFNNQFISLITSLYSKASIAVRYEFTNNDFDPSGRKDWLAAEIGYRITGANLITASYGRERGGQVCSNGICRYILPFKGFRLTLQTSI